MATETRETKTKEPRSRVAESGRRLAAKEGAPAAAARP